MVSTPNGAGSLPAGPRKSLRLAFITRAVVLLIVGIAIAFTAVLHGDVAFDILLAGLSFAAIGFATGIEYFALRGTPESWWVAARAIIAFGAFGATLAVADSVGLALVIAVWAALTAVTTAMRLARGAQPRGVALPSLLLSVALTIVVLFTLNDSVATIGFFGAYAILRGVFLGISAFDTRFSRAEADKDAAQLPTSSTESI